MKLAGGSCALQVHSSGQKWLVGTVLAFSLTIFWSNVVLMPLSYSSVRLMLFGSFHVILIVVSPGMTYKTGQMSVDASVRAVLTFLKSWDSETTGPVFMRLGIYILWVLQKNFQEVEFWLSRPVPHVAPGSYLGRFLRFNKLLRTSASEQHDLMYLGKEFDARIFSASYRRNQCKRERWQRPEWAELCYIAILF